MLLLDYFLADGLVGVEETEDVDHEVSGHEMILRIFFWFDGLGVQLIHEFLPQLSHAILGMRTVRSR